jgi:hypothetical protein
MTQGDLQELLGQVPTYNSSVEEQAPKGLPQLANDVEHPYHLVVMCAILSFHLPIIHDYYYFSQRRTRVP